MAARLTHLTRMRFRIAPSKEGTSVFVAFRFLARNCPCC